MIFGIVHAVLVAAAVRVAWVDCRQYQIDYMSLAVILMAGIVVVAMEDGAATVLRGVLAAGGVVGTLGLVVRLGLCRRPGAGDWFLLPVCLFLGARNLLLFAGLLAVAGFLVAAVYGWRRRRALFRSRFPLAPPALLAAVMAFVVRDDVSGGFW